MNLIIVGEIVQGDYQNGNFGKKIIIQVFLWFLEGNKINLFPKRK